MRYLNTMQMLSEQINISDIVSVVVREPVGLHRTFEGKVRQCNVLMLYNIGKRRYTVHKSGRQFDLNEHEILYIPQYAEYSFDILDCSGQAADYALAVNFCMQDENGEPVCLGEEPRVLTADRLSHYFSLFTRLDKACDVSKTGLMYQKSLLYSLLYEILTETRANETKGNPYSIIAPAIDLIENTPQNDIPVPVMAKQCKIGETRFRQLFLQYSGGISPVEYRNRLRIDRAEKLIKTELVTVGYAASAVGFRDLSHFYRLYKKYKGETPCKNGKASV